MTTSSHEAATTPPPRSPLRLRLGAATDDDVVDGAWWPQSRNLQVEAADLVDHFPADMGHVSRLLFSRPDWDDSTGDDGRGVRQVGTARGPVKTGSFPSDDTGLMIVTLSTGRRLRLRVIPSSTPPGEAEPLLHSAGRLPSPSGERDTSQRWDDESPGH